MPEPCFPRNGKCELACTCDWSTGKHATWREAGAALDAHLSGANTLPDGPFAHTERPRPENETTVFPTGLPADLKIDGAL